MGSSTLQDKIKADVIVAMKSKEDNQAKARLAVLRLVMAAIKQKQIDNGRIVLDDAGVLVVLDKMVKQRKESMVMYEKAGRQDLYNQESFELDIITGYMPKPLSTTEIAKFIDDAMLETGAKSIKDMGKVMAFLKPELQGRADMSAVSSQIKAKLI